MTRFVTLIYVTSLSMSESITHELVDLPSGLVLETSLYVPQLHDTSSTGSKGLVICLHPWSRLGGNINDPCVNHLVCSPIRSLSKQSGPKGTVISDRIYCSRTWIPCSAVQFSRSWQVIWVGLVFWLDGRQWPGRIGAMGIEEYTIREIPHIAGKWFYVCVPPLTANGEHRDIRMDPL